MVHVKSVLQCEIRSIDLREKLNAFSSRQQLAMSSQASCSYFTISGLTYLSGDLHADVTVYIFAHLHTALNTDGNVLGIN